MRIELISTGDELLTGDITDTNASWLAQTLAESGYKLKYKTTVADDLEELATTFLQRSHFADFIIVNGGLGPTVDDLSAEAMAKASGQQQVMFDAWVEQMEQKFASMNREMLASNLKQAFLPQSAEIIDNPFGTACGFKVVLNDCTFVFTPGVPQEFMPMVQQQILPLLKSADTSANSSADLQIHRYLCLGIGESNLANMMTHIQLPEGCEFGYRSAMPYLELKVFAQGGHDLTAQLQQVEQIVAPFCVVKGGNNLPEHVHDLLLAKAASSDCEYKFATVESCTGGMVASQLVHFSGSSSYLNRGLVTYSNEAKRQLADVSEQTLIDFGAVSPQVAEQMAQGAVKKWRLDLAVSITGVAGPTGGSEQKPVGTVAFAIATPDTVVSQTLQLPNRGRNYVRKTAAAIALDMVRRQLLDENVLAQFSSFKPIELGE